MFGEKEFNGMREINKLLIEFIGDKLLLTGVENS